MKTSLKLPPLLLLLALPAMPALAQDYCAKADELRRMAAREQGWANGPQGDIHARAAQQLLNAAAQYDAQCAQMRNNSGKAAERSPASEIIRSTQQAMDNNNRAMNQLGQQLQDQFAPKPQDSTPDSQAGADWANRRTDSSPPFQPPQNTVFYEPAPQPVLPPTSDYQPLYQPPSQAPPPPPEPYQPPQSIGQLWDNSAPAAAAPSQGGILSIPPGTQLTSIFDPVRSLPPADPDAPSSSVKLSDLVDSDGEPTHSLSDTIKDWFSPPLLSGEDLTYEEKTQQLLADERKKQEPGLDDKIWHAILAPLAYPVADKIIQFNQWRNQQQKDLSDKWNNPFGGVMDPDSGSQ
jgi:hypothetical protein